MQFCHAVALLGFTLLSLQAGDKNSVPAFHSTPATEISRHHFSAGLSVLHGAEVRFSGLGGFINPRNTTLGLGSGEGIYDDGFVRPDSGDGEDGLTWNWGYDTNSQWDAPGDALHMKIDNARPSRTVDETETAPGFELEYGILLGEVPGIGGAAWGVNARLGYHRLSSMRSLRIRNDVDRATDRFGLGGIIPPQAPYHGSFTGPGPLLEEASTRSLSTIRGLALADVSLESEAHLFSFGLGPTLAMPLDERIGLTLGAGTVATFIHSRMQVDQIVSIPGIEVQRTSHRDSDSDCLFGVYAELGLRVALTDSLSLVASGRWQSMDSFRHGAGGFEVDYDFDRLFVGGLGLSWQR